MQLSNNQESFLALVKAGLWETEVRLAPYEKIDFQKVYKLAQEQSVIGLVAAGLEHIVDIKAPKDVILQFVGGTLQLEKRNKEMNDFIPKLIKSLNKNVYSLLVKGQGVAQCYERPLWRAAGDVDLLLDDNNYEKAKQKLFPIAYDIQKENLYTKHQALAIMGVEVELHAKMPFAMSKRVDNEIDEVLNDSLNNNGVCVWRVNETDVYLPKPDNHVILVFTHFLHHFFIEGVGLRQICDWCRMLWTYRDSLDYELLKSRIKRMGLMSEWQTFAALAVDTLGIPVEAMPFYDKRYKRNTKRVLNRILKSGNFGHNNDLSYRTKYKGLTYNVVSLWRRFVDFVGFSFLFPIDAPKFFIAYVSTKLKGADL